MALKRVVVTGMGVLSPIGNNVKSYWDGLANGKSGAGPITHFDASKFKTQFACELKDFVPSTVLSKRETRKLDDFAVYALYATDEAMKDAGFSMEEIDPNRAGVIYGSGIGGLNTLEAQILEFGEGDGSPWFSPFLVPRMIVDIAAGHISIKYGLRGVNFATVSACATSSHAITSAFDAIRLGRADIVVTGGSEAPIVRTSIGGFNSMKALSQSNDSPTTASRPYDKDRNGFVMGEGAGTLILEEYEHAKKRGAKIYAEIAGAGMTGDAYHITAPHPEGLGAAKAMQFALEDAKLNVQDIDYINTHGTSTPLGDVAEVKAISAVFGHHAYDLNISSTKSMTGHLLGAAGVIESIAGILALNNHLVPPTINHFTDDPALDSKLNFTFNQAQEKKINTVLSNTFGFGGHNSTLIFKACS